MLQATALYSDDRPQRCNDANDVMRLMKRALWGLTKASDAPQIEIFIQSYVVAAPLIEVAYAADFGVALLFVLESLCKRAD
jgi:hypothetical protein